MSIARAKNFRRRGRHDDDDDDPNAASFLAAASSSKPLPKKPPGSKLLSFADDDEDASPTIPLPKPSSSSSSRPNKPLFSSRKSAAAAAAAAVASKSSAPPPHTPSNVQSQAGMYTKEALLELQKNTRTLASSSRPDPKSEPVIVLKGLVKPQTLGLGEDQPRDEQQSEAGDGDDMEEKTYDRDMIEKIRAERERKRQSREAPQFIPLESGGSGRSKTLEDLSDEEPEFLNRMPMLGERTGDLKKGVFDSFRDKAVVSRKEHRIQEDEDDDDEEAEKEWEEEQVKKGLLKRMDEVPGRGVNNGIGGIVSVPVMPQKFAYPATNVSAAPPPIPSIGGAVRLAEGLEEMSIAQQAELAKKTLFENAKRIKETHGRTLLSLTKTDENLSASLLNIEAFEKSLEAAGEKYIFVQKLRDYISVICKFLQDKAPYIEELEEQMQKLNEERASAVLERRTADNEDEMTEIETAVNAAMKVIRKGDNSAATVAAAAAAAQAAVSALKEQSGLAVKLDEFGRDINLQKRMDMNRRAEARQRRKTWFEAKRRSSMDIDSPYQKIEGESSTDESDGESKAYQSNRELLLQTADQIFDDTADEFAKLSEVKEKFEKWKRNYISSYHDAYMSLSVPNIFSPYVRLELLKWDPLHENSNFFYMKWHSLLFDYGLPEDGGEFSPEDADANLVPGLVEKVALPILHHEIARCWDMLSFQETKNAVSATTMVINYVSTSSEALGTLLVAIRTRLADAITNLVVPTWGPLVVKAVPSAARVTAYRFGMSVRLLRNICLWKEILALPVLEKLALDELLGEKILPHVRSIVSDIHDAVTRTERIVASMSGVWAGPSVVGERSRKLRPLVDHVLILGQTLQKKHSSGVTESEINGLARRLKKMLVELNEYDCARELAKAFHLREAL